MHPRDPREILIELATRMSAKQRQQSKDEVGLELSSLIPSTTSPSDDKPHTAHRKHVHEEDRDHHAASRREDKPPLGRGNSNQHRNQNGYEHSNGHRHAPGEDSEEFEIVEEAVGSQSEENGGGARISNVTLALASMVASGVQFGWALQLSLLTPYVQVSHPCRDQRTRSQDFEGRPRMTLSYLGCDTGCLQAFAPFDVTISNNRSEAS